MWQRGYHDHVVRDEEDLARIREYIASNPIRWALDPENPERRP
jgi:REP element-mobilizing transposase RayT